MGQQLSKCAVLLKRLALRAIFREDGTAFLEEHRIRGYEVGPDQETTIVTMANLLQVPRPSCFCWSCRSPASHTFKVASVRYRHQCRHAKSSADRACWTRPMSIALYAGGGR